MNNTPTITSIPQLNTVPTWYDSLKGSFFRSGMDNNGAGTSAADSMDEQVFLFLVEDGYSAQINASLGVDDWGYLKIVDADGKECLMLSMQSNVDAEPGPRGGHTYWEKTGEAALPSGLYTITVHHENTTYPPQFNPKNNDSKCDFSITATKEPKILTILTADEYGEIVETGTDCNAYIKQGDRINDKKHHAISVGLEYEGPSPDDSFDGTPSSSRGEVDHFKPATIILGVDGKARFKVWNEDSTKNSQIKLNGAVSHDVTFLPAVFEDLFKITVYFTIKESGCSGNQQTTLLCKVGSSNSSEATSITVKASFATQVRLEGFGELDSPYVAASGKKYSYLAYYQGYYLSENVLGNRNNVLEPKISCAAFGPQFATGSRIRVVFEDESLQAAFGGDEFVVADVGDAIGPNRLDLYWGADVPSANNSSIPAGLPNGLPSTYSFRVILLSE